MPPLERRSYSRSMLRGYVAELRRMGLFDELRARCAAEVVALLDDPRNAPSWVDAEPFAEVHAVVAALRGREAVRELGYGIARNGGFASVLEPIIHFSLLVIGGGPSSLLARAQLMASVMTRGFELEWVPTGPASGSMKMRCKTAMADVSWALWEGGILHALEVAGAKGTVAPARASDDGRSCEIDVSWAQPPRHVANHLTSL